MLPLLFGVAGALLAKGLTKDDVIEELKKKEAFLDKEIYTTEDVAKISGLSEYTVRKKIRDGDLPADGEGNRSGYRIKKEDLKTFLDTQRSFERNSNLAAKEWSVEELRKLVTGSENEKKPSLEKTVVGGALGAAIGSSFPAAAGLAMLGGFAPIVGLMVGQALFSGSKEVAKQDIEGFDEVLNDVRLLKKYINMRKKLLEQLKLEEEEMRISYKGKLEDDEYRLKEIEQKKKINDVELELEALQSQLEELEKHTKEKK